VLPNFKDPSSRSSPARLRKLRTYSLFHWLPGASHDGTYLDQRTHEQPHDRTVARKMLLELLS
jgi:hypothetical protein